MCRTALAALLLASLPRAIHAEIIVGHAFAKSYIVEITGEALKKTPAWDQSREHPPLSARRALKLATDFRKTLMPDSADWSWSLEYLGLRQTEGKWYWLACFEALPRNAGASGPPRLLYVPVLMDGTVIRPKIKDDPGAQPSYE